MVEFSSLGIPRVDECIGLLPLGTSVSVCGGPGTGKTAFCLTATAGSITAGENVLFFTTKERTRKMIDYARSFGFGIEKWLETGKLYLEEIKPVDIKQMAKNESIRIFELIQAYNARKIIVDSMNYIIEAFPTTYEQMTYSLKILNEMTRHNSILIGTYDLLESSYGKGILEYITDVNFVLSNELLYGKLARNLKIAKARGIEIKKSSLQFTIGGSGFSTSEKSSHPELERKERAPNTWDFTAEIRKKMGAADA